MFLRAVIAILIVTARPENRPRNRLIGFPENGIVPPLSRRPPVSNGRIQTDGERVAFARRGNPERDARCFRDAER